MADLPQKPLEGKEPIQAPTNVSSPEEPEENQTIDIEADPDIQELEKELKDIVTEAETSPSNIPESGVLEHKGSLPSANPQEDISHILESEKIPLEPTPEPPVMKTEIVEETLPQEPPYVPSPREEPVVEEEVVSKEIEPQETIGETEAETSEPEEVSVESTVAPIPEISSQPQEESREPSLPEQTVQEPSVEVPFETKASFHIEEEPEPQPVENKKVKILTLLLLIVLFLILSLIIVSILRKQGQFPFLQGMTSPSISLQKKPPSLPPDAEETTEKPEAKLFTETQSSPSASESSEASESSGQ